MSDPASIPEGTLAEVLPANQVGILVEAMLLEEDSRDQRQLPPEGGFSWAKSPLSLQTPDQEGRVIDLIFLSSVGSAVVAVRYGKLQADILRSV